MMATGVWLYVMKGGHHRGYDAGAVIGIANPDTYNTLAEPPPLSPREKEFAALVFVEGASAEDVVPLLGKTFKLDIDSLAADAPAEEIKLRDAVDGRKTFNRGQCPSVTLASALNARRPGTIPSGEISSHLIDMEAK